MESKSPNGAIGFTWKPQEMETGEQNPTREIHSAAILAGTLSELSIVGRMVSSVDIVGMILISDRSSMIDYYNDVVRKDGEPYRRSTRPIYQDEIPLSTPRTRLVLSDGPFIIGFDDGMMFEIAIPDPSCAFVRFDHDIGAHPQNAFVNASGILRPIIGETITNIEVRPMNQNDQELDYISQTCQSDAFKMCLIRCEEHALGIFWSTCIVMTNAEKPWPLEMTMGELKSNISYYDELFDKR